MLCRLNYNRFFKENLDFRNENKNTLIKNKTLSGKAYLLLLTIFTI